MDNGLIFPYPCGRAHAEPGDANHCCDVGTCVDVVVLGTDLVVGERWGDAGR